MRLPLPDLSGLAMTTGGGSGKLRLSHLRLAMTKRLFPPTRPEMRHYPDISGRHTTGGSTELEPTLQFTYRPRPPPPIQAEVSADLSASVESTL